MTTRLTPYLAIIISYVLFSALPLLQKTVQFENLFKKKDPLAAKLTQFLSLNIFFPLLFFLQYIFVFFHVIRHWLLLLFWFLILALNKSNEPEVECHVLTLNSCVVSSSMCGLFHHGSRQDQFEQQRYVTFMLFLSWWWQPMIVLRHASLQSSFFISTELKLLGHTK